MTTAAYSGGKNKGSKKSASNTKGSKMKVYKVISEISRELATAGIGKNGDNKKQGYSFRKVDDVFFALCGLLVTHGLVIVPRVSSVTREKVTSSSGGTLLYSTATVEYDLICVEDGSKHTACVIGEGMDSGDKASNKAMAAAYKYMAFQTFCIPVKGVMIDSEPDDHELKPANRYARCQTMEELQAAFGADYQAAKDMNDKEAAGAATAAYKVRKEELSK